MLLRGAAADPALRPCPAVPAVEAAKAEDIEEEAYTFVKRVAQLFSLLGVTQLCPLWTLGVTREPPEHYELFVQALLAFAAHPSPLVCSFTLPCWQQLLKMAEARTHHVLDQAAIPLPEQVLLRCVGVSVARRAESGVAPCAQSPCARTPCAQPPPHPLFI